MKSQVIIFSTLIFSILFSCSKSEKRTEEVVKERATSDSKIKASENLPQKNSDLDQFKELKKMLVKCGKIHQDTPIETIQEMTKLNFH